MPKARSSAWPGPRRSSQQWGGARSCLNTFSQEGPWGIRATGTWFTGSDQQVGELESGAAHRLGPLHSHESEKVIGDDEESSQKHKDHQYVVFHIPDLPWFFGTAEDSGVVQLKRPSLSGVLSLSS
jgi:hypothetical protein